MKKMILAVMVTGLIGGFGSAVAGDAAAGKAKYAGCMGCHGATGAGNAAAGYPALAGKDAAFIVEQLKAFKSGARKNPTMNAMAAGLSDADMENIGAHVATMK
jgi:cytochrome c553